MWIYAKHVSTRIAVHQPLSDLEESCFCELKQEEKWGSEEPVHAP
jgi:hypothetical protein